ncbi:tyrosine-protein phosphatase, partial [Streptomyces sp. JAC128]|uniref:tyrosine-protein phosphatase n=1 Tax=Streptomyces sp. JAC128 TaxID=3418412 RepID=UPI003D812C66
GKDRTGWAAALLLMMAGAAREAVRAEVLAVDRAVPTAFGPAGRRFLDQGGDPGIASAVGEARPRYLEAALHAMDARGW